MPDLRTYDIPRAAVAIAFEDALEGVEHWRRVHEQQHRCGGACVRGMELLWAQLIFATWTDPRVGADDLRVAIEITFGGVR